jgi:chemotaxis protein methyltransferase CheR
MTDPLRALETDRFRDGIARRLGLHFEDSRSGFLAEVLQRRLDRTGLAAGAYLERLDSTAPFADEVSQLAREVTVGETYFFRNIDQFRAVAEVVLPERIAARAATRTLSLLSAGCASGEEPYSLAMIAREQLADARWTVSIRGIDVNPAALEKAVAARYSTWSLRETPADAQTRWFRPQGRELTLVDPIRDAVRFDERNLTADDPLLLAPGSYDLILCRNVIMYFTLATAQAVIARLTRALVPGGYLFLGHAETLRGLSHDFHLRHTHGTFYYQRRDARADAGRLDGASGPRADDGSTSWIEMIQRASDRIRTLAAERDDDQVRPQASGLRPDEIRPRASGLRPQSSDPDPDPEARGPRPEALPEALPPAPDLAPIMESLARERYTEALGLLHALPSEAAADPDSLLLRAALLTHSGRLDDAERACAELLGLDELNAGAHYLLALCREGRGDRAAAIDHDQVAVYLDPAFAMPRLHMGLLARRSGQADLARRELGLALPLLQREDSSRLLLFGGGFNRDTLTALCRAELGATQVSS